MFVQYQAGFDAHNLQLSLRQDDNAQFGSHVTGGIAWGYAWSEALRVTASHGTAFKAPTFNELYYPGFSEPNLRPETAATSEVGLAAKTAAGRLSLQVFQTRIEDLITYDASLSKPVNIDRARVRGVEAVHDLSAGDWNLRTALNWLDPRNQASGANNGKVLARRVRQSLRMEVDRAIGEHSVGATLLAEGARFDEVANTTRVGGYGLLDLRAEYRLSRDLRLQGRIDNVFDKSYETFAYFHQPGRSAFLFLRYEP